MALKIANKIRAREKFAAYIVIPMWPEGAPTSNPIQRILYWQVKQFVHYLLNDVISINTDILFMIIAAQNYANDVSNHPQGTYGSWT